METKHSTLTRRADSACHRNALEFRVRPAAPSASHPSIVPSPYGLPRSRLLSPKASIVIEMLWLWAGRVSIIASRDEEPLLRSAPRRSSRGG